MTDLTLDSDVLISGYAIFIRIQKETLYFGTIGHCTRGIESLRHALFLVRSREVNTYNV